jgi:hypothetical protein
MENTGFKGLGLTLWQRVVLSYKSTLLGLLVLAAGVVAENFVNSPNKILSTVGAIIGAVLIMLKDKVPTPPPPAP